MVLTSSFTFQAPPWQKTLFAEDFASQSNAENLFPVVALVLRARVSRVAPRAEATQGF